MNNIIVGEVHELPLQNCDSAEKRLKRRQMIIPKVIGKIKMLSAKEINIERKTIGFKVWQRNYHDHIIRKEKELEEIRKYIEYNPHKWKEDDYYL